MLYGVLSPGCCPLSVLLPLWCHSQSLWALLPNPIQRQPSSTAWPDCGGMSWRLCLEHCKSSLPLELLNTHRQEHWIPVPLASFQVSSQEIPEPCPSWWRRGQRGSYPPPGELCRFDVSLQTGHCWWFEAGRAEQEWFPCVSRGAAASAAGGAEPCWQSLRGERGAAPAPRCHPGYQGSLLPCSTSPKPFAGIHCNSYGSTVW